MENVLIVIHLIVVVVMAVLILLQRSEGGALGIGGGGNNFMSGRKQANPLTRSTSILAAAFFATSIGLTILANVNQGSSILDQLPGQDGGIQPLAPVPLTPQTNVPQPPSDVPARPQVPTAE